MEKEVLITASSLRIGFFSGRKQIIVYPDMDVSASGGELIAVIGRNGIGKSTLLRTLAGLQPALGGIITVSGKAMSEYSRPELARKIGYVSTEKVNVNSMSVFELVALGRFPHTNWLGSLDEQDTRSVTEAIRITGLEGFENRHLSEISDGERQRAMIARALAQDSELMVMDEPTAYLDIKGRYEITRLAYDLTRKGKSVIYSTHDLRPALKTADRIWLMLPGSLIEGTPDEIVRKGSLNRLFGTEEQKIRYPQDGEAAAGAAGIEDYLKYFL